MDLILALIADQIAHAGTAGVAKAEATLHERLRIRREREQPCDDLRLALAACYARRVQIGAED